MKVRELFEALQGDDLSLFMMLPSGEFVPEHFHITEVGQVVKTFVDCGGTQRSSFSCMLQVWTANDVDHRLTSGKLLKIFEFAKPLMVSDWLVEVEYGADVASQYQLFNIERTPKGLLFILAGKQTACLAPDKCGLSGCC